MMFQQPDTLIPDLYQPNDWNRYLYARANPLRYSDPTGHCSQEGDDWCYEEEQSNPVPPSVETNSVGLSGGTGTNPPEDYTGFSTSGESTNPFINGLVGVPSAANGAIVWIRDNSHYWQYDDRFIDVKGQVYFDLTDHGYTVIGASISNTSSESLKITKATLNEYSFYNKDKLVSSQKIFPSNKPTLVSQTYGYSNPNSNSGIIKFDSPNISNDTWAAVNIFITSPSGRWGFLDVMFIVNPPER